LNLISKFEDSKNKIELLKLLNLGLGTGFKKNQTGTGSGFDFFSKFSALYYIKIHLRKPKISSILCQKCAKSNKKQGWSNGFFGWVLTGFNGFYWAVSKRLK
jgi:hypothetical protein